MVAHYSAWASAEREAVALLNYGSIRVFQRYFGAFRGFS